MYLTAPPPAASIQAHSFISSENCHATAIITTFCQRFLLHQAHFTAPPPARGTQAHFSCSYRRCHFTTISPHMAATATKHHSDSAQPGLPALLHSTGQGHIMDHINCIISRAYHTISAKHSLYNITGITAHLDSGQGRHPRLERRGQPTPHHPLTPVVHTEAPGDAMPSRSVHQPAHHRSSGPPALPLQRTIITQRLGENRPPDTTGTGITGFPE
jgi:hypothetical protein